MSNLFIGLFLFIVSAILFASNFKQIFKIQKQNRLRDKKMHLVLQINSILIIISLIFFCRFISVVILFNISIYMLILINIIFIVLAVIVLSFTVQVLKTNISYNNPFEAILLMITIIMSTLLVFLPIITFCATFCS